MTETDMSERKRQALDRCREYWMPGRVDTFVHWGIPVVIGRREGYRMWDIDGHELIDVHLNGGTFNLSGTVTRGRRLPIASSIARSSPSSSGDTNVNASPVASARAVRPTRWM